jgi:hypothetical protein
MLLQWNAGFKDIGSLATNYLLTDINVLQL